MIFSVIKGGNVRNLARLIIAFMISFSLTEMPIMRAHAAGGLISTQEAVTDFNRAMGEQNLKDFMKRSDVKDKLVAMGLDPAEADRRIASLSDKEVKRLNNDIEKAQAAGSVTGILVVVLLVILIIYYARRI